jgi:outer membrane lipoprotein-sorting protein
MVLGKMGLILERRNGVGYSMMPSRRLGAAGAVAALLALLGVAAVQAQQLDSSTVIQAVDAAVKSRVDQVASYTVTEHYAVYRGGDATHPAAEMTVKTDYRKETGKNYTIVSQSGSEIIRKLVLGAILDREKTINLPGNREGSWLTSANYEMKLKPGGVQPQDGRECLVLAISPKRKAPNLIEGTVWVDAQDGSIVGIEGTASQSPSVFSGPAQVARQYANVSGFAMATHATAVSDSFLFGRTTIKIDYRDYQIQLVAAQ